MTLIKEKDSNDNVSTKNRLSQKQQILLELPYGIADKDISFNLIELGNGRFTFEKRDDILNMVSIMKTWSQKSNFINENQYQKYIRTKQQEYSIKSGGQNKLNLENKKD